MGPIRFGSCSAFLLACTRGVVPCRAPGRCQAVAPGPAAPLGANAVVAPSHCLCMRPLLLGPAAALARGWPGAWHRWLGARPACTASPQPPAAGVLPHTRHSPAAPRAAGARGYPPRFLTASHSLRGSWACWLRPGSFGEQRQLLPRGKSFRCYRGVCANWRLPQPTQPR